MFVKPALKRAGFIFYRNILGECLCSFLKILLLHKTIIIPIMKTNFKNITAKAFLILGFVSFTFSHHVLKKMIQKQLLKNS